MTPLPNQIAACKLVWCGKAVKIPILNDVVHEINGIGQLHTQTPTCANSMHDIVNLTMLYIVDNVVYKLVEFGAGAHQ